MTREKKGKQKTRKRVRGEILERFPDAEERFQEAFEKLTKSTKKQVDRKSARALDAKRKIKRWRAGSIHKKPIEDRRNYHEAKLQEREANRHKFAYELLAEIAEIEVIEVESVSVLERLAEKLHEKQEKWYLERHGRARPRKGVSKNEIKSQIASPFRRIIDKDDHLLTLQWSIPGGVKEYSKLLKKYGMLHISPKDDESMQFESYMIYNMKSRIVKYDSVASELLSETTLEITPKTVHHSQLTISLDKKSWTESYYDCWGNVTQQRVHNLEASMKLSSANGYIDSFNRDTIHGEIEFTLTEEFTVGSGIPRTYLTFVGRDGTRPVWLDRRGDPFTSTLSVAPNADRIIGGWVEVEDGYTDYEPVKFDFTFGIEAGDAVDLSVEVQADADNENIDTFDLNARNPYELILLNYETRSVWDVIFGWPGTCPIAGHFKDGGYLYFSFDIRPSYPTDESRAIEKGKLCFDIPVQYGYWLVSPSGWNHFDSHICGLWDTFDSDTMQTIEYIRGDAVKEPATTFLPSSPIPIEYHPPNQPVDHTLRVQLTNNSGVPLSQVFLLSVDGFNRSGVVFVPSSSSSSQEWEAADDTELILKDNTKDFIFKFRTDGVGDAYPIFHLQYTFKGVPEIVSFPLGRDFKEFLGPTFIVSPRDVEGLQATQVPNGVELSWTSNTIAAYAPAEPGIYYKVYRNGNPVAIAQLDDNDSVADMVYLDEDVVIGSQYSYQVSVVAHFLESEPSEPVPSEAILESELFGATAQLSPATSSQRLAMREGKLSDTVRIEVKDIIPPARVIGLIAHLTEDNEVALSWESSPESDLDHYIIYRDGTKIKEVTASSYTYSEESTALDHTYQISAVDTSDNEGDKSDSVTIFVPDVTPPSKVTNLEATMSIIKDMLCVDLHWNHNKESDLKHYNVVRDSALIKTINKNNYLDSKIESWKTYAYNVSATDLSDNEGKQSATVRITPGILGNKNTREFHLPYCVHVKRMNEDNKVKLNSIQEAKTMEYNGCYWCLRGYDTG